MISSLLPSRSRPRSLLLVALVCLAFGQVASAFEVGAAAMEACEQSCPGEEPGAGDHCDPLCDSCTCCSFAPQVPLRPTPGAPILRSMPHAAAQRSAPLSPDPSGILHVPRPSPA